MKVLTLELPAMYGDHHVVDVRRILFDMPGVVEAHIRETPVGRMGTLDDMAEAALFLADDSRSGYINGTVVDLAGGQQMGHLPRFGEL